MPEARLIHGMVVQGRNNNKHHGPTAVESPDKKGIVSCVELRERVATLAATLKR